MGARRGIRCAWGKALLGLLLGAAPAAAQVTPVDTATGVRILQVARQHFRGITGAAPGGRSDALADTLVLLALSSARDASAFRVALGRTAMIELAIAGNGKPGAYAGSVPRLLRVARDAPNDSVAHTALTMLCEMHDTTAAAAALAELAMQPRHQPSAVWSLIFFYGSLAAGKTAAIRLHREGKITDELARYDLERFVRRLN